MDKEYKTGTQTVNEKQILGYIRKEINKYHSPSTPPHAYISHILEWDPGFDSRLYQTFFFGITGYGTGSPQSHEDNRVAAWYEK